MDGNGNGKREPEELENTKPEAFGNPLEHWKKDYPASPASSDISDIYELPDIDNFAEIMERGVFKTEDDIDYMAVCWYLDDMFGLEKGKEMLRIKIAGTIGVGGAGRLDAIFAKTRLFAPDSYRVMRKLPKNKDEKVYRSSDFREDTQQKPDGR